MNKIAFCSRIQIDFQESSGLYVSESILEIGSGHSARWIVSLAFSTLPGFCACPGSVQFTRASTPGHGGRHRVIWLLALHGPRPCLAHAAGEMAHGVRLAGKAVSKSGVLSGSLPDRRPLFEALCKVSPESGCCRRHFSHSVFSSLSSCPPIRLKPCSPTARPARAC